jgi:Co/Zn/Cd efflux system component
MINRLIKFIKSINVTYIGNIYVFVVLFLYYSFGVKLPDIVTSTAILMLVFILAIQVIGLSKDKNKRRKTNER